MARLFPLRSETPATEGQPRVVDLEDEDADAVFSALSSTTARKIYTTLNNEPGTPSDVADAIDSSIQNVRYHLEKLEDAGLVEVVDTWYSSRGNEMSVYATADGPLIVTSDQSKAAQLKTALSRFIGGVAALAGGSLLVQYGLSEYFSPPADDAAAAPAGADGGDMAAEGQDDGDSSADSPESEPTDDSPEAEETTTDDSTTADDDGGVGTAEAEEEEATEDTGDDGLEAQDEPDSVEDSEEPTATEDAGDDAGTTTDDAASDGDTYVVETTDDGNVTGEGAAEAADAIFATIPPGLLFFLGGLVVLTAVTVYWYWSTTY
ncbi:helix-turn-helix domain-containing protein [Halobacteria archaeon AArc-curdl1]|uniref:Helix-turn-helix domain-containing protein n=1 Tax=Natronosalvus hydrolyticus TaxID=2979988 RepID=A0AAP2Z821_9EURY|nr:helix-turn-helix domain-containing protein [Halobacteria archaeon AArc-curdl1]